jgi:hypothetical protein
VYDSRASSWPGRRARRARSNVRGAEREAGLQDGPPTAQPVAVDGFELLHVHQAVADLDRGVALLREEVELVAGVLASGVRAARRSSGAEALAEGAPLQRGMIPIGASRLGDPVPLLTLAPPPVLGEELERLRVFVSARRDVHPRETRKARVSAAA